MILGVDFTSAPRPGKAITIARGHLAGDTLAVDRVDRVEDWRGFEALLRAPGPWVAGFDFPFSLPRALVEDLGWPRAWPALIRHYAMLDRGAVTREFDAWRARRPAGAKYAHRACDAHSRAHSSMKLVNPPVAWMLHEGAPRLLDAGVHLPALHDGDRARVALEAYPGLLVRRVAQATGRRIVSYKNDAKAKQTPARERERVFIVDALEQDPHRSGVRVALGAEVRRQAVADPTGDTLDAIACAAQAAWGAQRAHTNYGLPAPGDFAEGWIVTAEVS